MVTASSIQSAPAYVAAGERWRSFSRFLQERFGRRVYRVTLDAGFTCPNVDGAVAVGGCVYCDNRSFSPNRRLPRQTITGQLERGMQILSARYGVERFLAYFQAATNTYAPIDKLRRLYDEATAHPRIVGLVIGTRPDCVSDEVIDLIEEYGQRMYVSVELGLQTIHDRSLDWMNRGHHADAFFDAVHRCTGRAFELCAHVILGLPGESHADMLATAEALAPLPIQAVKLHNLHVVKDTPLEGMYRAGEVRMLEFDEYVSLVCDFLERLPPQMVIERLSGDAPPNYLIAPAWCLEKQRILQALQREFARRQSWQGKHYHAGVPAPTTTTRRALPVCSPRPMAGG